MFVGRSSYPDKYSEKARYDQHRNNPKDPGYQAFLNRLATPLLARVSPGTHGLDFGCGPGPALAQILRRSGMEVDLYDAFYAYDESVWSRQYDFITATEVIEHLHNPSNEFDRLFSALRPGGWLGIMTKWVSSITSFEHSRYVRDPTHVCLYSRETLTWVANRWEVEVEFPSPDISLFRVI